MQHILLRMLFTVLPTIGSSQEMSAHAEIDDILRGDLSRVSRPQPNTVRVYLCYDFEGYYSDIYWNTVPNL